MLNYFIMINNWNETLFININDLSYNTVIYLCNSTNTFN